MQNGDGLRFCPTATVSNTLFLGRLRPAKRLTSTDCTYFCQYWLKYANIIPHSDKVTIRSNPQENWPHRICQKKKKKKKPTQTSLFLPCPCFHAFARAIRGIPMYSEEYTRRAQIHPLYPAWGPPRGLGELGRKVIYFQGAGKHYIAIIFWELRGRGGGGGALYLRKLWRTIRIRFS